ncbi:hypothetical protein Tco_0183303 [Tanacetum coccineum]
MSEEDQAVGPTALPKFDMPSYESQMTAKDIKSLAIRHGIPLDLHPVALTEGWTMDKLPDDMIGLYEQYFERAILDAMAWRHHDSDINDPVLEDGFSVQDVQTLTERSFRHFLMSFFVVVTMSEYLRFPFLSGATIEKGTALTNQDQRARHTIPPLPMNQAIPDKTVHQKVVEVEDHKIVAIRKRKARDAAKKREKKKRGDDEG